MDRIRRSQRPIDPLPGIDEIKLESQPHGRGQPDQPFDGCGFASFHEINEIFRDTRPVSQLVNSPCRPRRASRTLPPISQLRAADRPPTSLTAASFDVSSHLEPIEDDRAQPERDCGQKC